MDNVGIASPKFPNNIPLEYRGSIGGGANSPTDAAVAVSLNVPPRRGRDYSANFLLLLNKFFYVFDLV